MALLVHIQPNLDVHVTEMTFGAQKSPPGEGWSVVAIVDGTSGPRIVWIRSKILNELEAEKKPAKGKKGT